MATDLRATEARERGQQNVAPVGPSTPRTEAPYFRADIEGLRAVAILLVVAFHTGLRGVPGGFIGVDVFFVLSGYLITGLLVREVETTGRLRLGNFYARRARRLLPASAVTVLATLLFGYLFLSPLERELYARSAFAAAVYASNIWFQTQASNYFASDTAENPLLHTWSLSVEEQFYLAWPLAIVLTFTAFRSRRALATVMLALCATSFVYCMWMVTVNQPGAFFGSPARAWEFGIGGVAALMPPAALSRFGRWTRVVGVLGFAGILAGALLIGAAMTFPNVAVLLPVLGTGAVLVAGAEGPDRIVGSLLRVRPLQYLGRVSYSWYLWHWPVLVLGVALFPSLPLPGRLALALGSLGIAIASHRLIENPIRFSRYLGSRPMLTLGLAVALTTTTAVASRLAKRSAVAAAATPGQRAVADASARLPGLYEAGCLLDAPDVQQRSCTFGDKAGRTTLVLFGDSHAAAWFSAYERVALTHGWRLVALTKSGCPTLRVPVLQWPTRQPYPECAVWRESAIRRILVLRPALVVLVNSDAHVNLPERGLVGRLSLAQWSDGLHQVLRTLDSAGIRTLVHRDTPGLRMDPAKCVSRAIARARPLDVCALSRRAATREDVYGATQAAAGTLASVSTIDLTDDFCDATRCAAVRRGMIVYRDPGHIADAYALSLAGDVERRVVPLVAPSMAPVGAGRVRGGY